ncbi:CubicO group peptidase, beta-lactamase class C family [Sphingomonas guangdongensis]|uniref:CubicO group peptidase, beta-lactamase class C family n=1 Tax=Sphingomonas guangdongensis TaxID=1141890 RepID=A0A285Q9M8_9SPHN|nr:serine hydrolase domain-containing protein [Sphingomonas guangdongensis]SOB78531.1 CubicO group peptidase, beta-lactamase class C family [Sphingomonas guangdongensis]
MTIGPIRLALLLLSAAAASGCARSLEDSAVDRAGSAARAATGASGLAIAVIERGRIEHVWTSGARNARGDTLQAQTVMYGASLTKAVFGYLVAQLADEGRIELDRPIAALLPRQLPAYGNLDAYGNWGDLAGDDRWRALTPRMLLNHASGFANFSFLEPDGRLRFHFAPGSRYAYSGEGIMLLQFVLEQGLGLDVEAELQRRIFVPAGATRTSLKWRADFASDLADGWDAAGKPHPHDERSRVRAAGSMDTTPWDMAHIAAFMIRGEGLSRRARAGWARGTLPITTRQQFPTLLPDAPPADRPLALAALGVIAFNGPQGPGWYKGGHDDITANTLVCVERRRRCVLVLANDVRAERAFPAIVRTILGDTGVPYRWEYPGLPAY